jgi:alkylation response protein AidB-like acyl-CoA dehydrogenase
LIDTSDIEAFRASVRAWLGSVAIPSPAGGLESRFAALRDWQYALHDAGLTGLTWPKAWGGQGLTYRHQHVLNIELVLARAPQPIGLIGLDVVGPSIGTYGTPRQRQELLPPLLSGAAIWCQGFSEPGAGSDLAAITTRARPADGHFVVEGQKVWTSWAPFADWCALLVRTGSASTRHRGLSYLLVDMRSPGITVRPLRQMTGESEFGEVFFDDVRVPATNLLGTPGQGWEIAMDTLSHERGTFGMRRQAEVSGQLWSAIDAMRASRPAEDPPPAGVIAAIGRALVSDKVLRAQVAATVDRADRGGGSPALDSVDKLVLAENEQVIFGALREVMGPLLNDLEGSAWQVRSAVVAHDYLYGRAASIYGGTSQIQRNIVAERMMGLPRA